MAKEEVKPYEILREGSEEVMRIDANSWSIVPSVEDYAEIMNDVMDKILEVPSVARVIFNQRRNYSYNFDQTQMLVEVAKIYHYLVKQKKILRLDSLGFKEEISRFLGQKLGELQYVLLNLLRSDPIGAYVEVKRFLREEKILIEREKDANIAEARTNYAKILLEVYNLLDKTKLIALVKNQLDGYHIGDRTIYRRVFRPVITPDFMYTRVMAKQPIDGEELDVYRVKKSDIVVFKLPNDVKNLYHVTPPEFKLNEDKYELLDLARTVLAEHKPRDEEFLDPEKMRKTFYNIGRDMIAELAEHKGLKLDYGEIEELAEILVRYTVGFGLIEILLQDPKVQDVTVNSPIGETPIFIVHQDYDECVTNILPSREDGDSWASKFRLISGRPLDEANPVLDTELNIPGARARVAVMQRPLSPGGLAYALRRHRDTPWTLPLFIKNRMLSPLAAGLIGFLADGGRTILVAGTRSSGKTSLLGAIMLEIMRRHRIITVEDTLELPIQSMRKLGYNIQSMKVRAALTAATNEVEADEGVRTSLRLGDSALIVGEIRSTEAKALWEAMRVGALANVVAGTIHGASPYGVYDRVVNDLGVPRTSFKATDIIITNNPVKSSDGLTKWKRTTQISEVRKHWEQDPLKEKGFLDLMKYNPKKDVLEATQDLINGGSEVLKSIAGNVKEWAGNWDKVWQNVLMRAQIKQLMVQYAEKTKINELLEAKYVVLGNDMFHKISDEVHEEVGSTDAKRVIFEWEEWLKKEIKKRSL